MKPLIFAVNVIAMVSGMVAITYSIEGCTAEVNPPTSQTEPTPAPTHTTPTPTTTPKPQPTPAPIPSTVPTTMPTVVVVPMPTSELDSGIPVSAIPDSGNYWGYEACYSQCNTGFYSRQCNSVPTQADIPHWNGCWDCMQVCFYKCQQTFYPDSGCTSAALPLSDASCAANVQYWLTAAGEAGVGCW